MRDVRYKAQRPTHRRVLMPEHFTILGVEHDTEEVWSRENGFVRELNNKVGDRLVEMLPEEFTIVGSADDPGEPVEGSADETGDDSSDQSASDDPDSQSSDSQADEK